MAFGNCVIYGKYGDQDIMVWTEVQNTNNTVAVAILSTLNQHYVQKQFHFQMVEKHFMNLLFFKVIQMTADWNGYVRRKTCPCPYSNGLA